MDEDILQLLQRLLDLRVEFVLVGGIAAAVHGSEQHGRDLDIVAPFTPENMARLLDALRDLHPKDSSRPALAEITASPETLARYRNLYLVTDLGKLDVLGEIPPLSGYAEVAAAAVHTRLLGRTCPVISLDQLIRIKESIGRPKDLIVVVELKAIRERLRGRPQSAS